ncbi:cellulose binding domain-containing protein [Dactylosporangium sp. NPDC051485]|uniref:cellulose binding domain-containing protein n=1 Tax=Dactylosporangium sp. NPDC051485 TaxID=3154846 RepID=UPI0034324358
MASRLRLALAAAAVLVTAGGIAAVASPAQAAGSLTATLSYDSDWGTGYQAKYTITNGTAATVSSWQVDFDLPSGSTLGSYWDTLASQSGTHVTAANRTYNGTLAPGGSTTFGFLVSGSGKPANCKINAASCAGVVDTQAPTAPTNLTVTGTTSSSVSLSWGASTDNVGVAGYDIYRAGTLAASVTGTSGTVSDLSASTAYTFTVKARDAAGNTSAASNQVSATTQAGGGGGGGGGGTTLAVAPYVDMGAWPTPVLTDMATGGNLKNFTLAFVNSAGCKASWFNAYDPRAAWAKDQIDAIRARGGDVKISFGGASGIELAQACTTPAAVAAEYQAVVDAYSLKYIDLDIEGAAVADPTTIARRSQALALLQAARPNVKISLTLPVLPEGLTSDGVNVVRSARDAGVNLDLVNIMAMDYQRSTGDYGAFAVQAAQSTFTQLKGLYPSKTDAQVWRMLGVTPMLGKNDDGGTYDQNAARRLVSFAQTNHLGMLSFWEEGRDRNACNGALYLCTNVPQAPYEFSKIFAGYTG